MIDFIIEADDRYVDLYLRLSRDDKSKGFSVSIENQDKMLTRYAELNHYIVRHRYIDDGESGYTFDRPDFDILKEDILAGRVKRLLIKDMSRLGRHNAKALLFMEESKDHECEVIALDDGYSNYQDNDSTIGIKTWHNELYVKESSKKVKNVIRMKQEEGKWITTPPYGYKKKKNTTCELEIDTVTAEVVKQIFQMYADGHGILSIARTLTKKNIPTPSAYLHEQRRKKDVTDKGRYSDIWNDKCIRRILTNEIYIGTLIQHKGECVKIRGRYKTLPKNEWISFENHHEAIVDKVLFQQCQSRLAERKFRSKRTRKESGIFHGILYCGECGSCLSPYRTQKDMRTGNTRYYCSTYRKQGKEYCSAKGITDVTLKTAITIFLQRCTKAYKMYLEKLQITAITNDDHIACYTRKLHSCEKQMRMLRKEIKQLLENKMKECMAQPDNDSFIQEAYQSLINDKIEQKKNCEAEMERLRKKTEEYDAKGNRYQNALMIMEEMIAGQKYTKQELHILFDKIIVYDDHVDFHCKGFFSDEVDAVVHLKDLNTDTMRYQRAILKEIQKQMVDGKFSFLKVHASLVKQGYAYSYKGVFRRQMHILEEQGIVTRPYKNKCAVFNKEKL